MVTRAPTEAQISASVEAVLRALLPPGWELSVERESRLGATPIPDLVATLTAPNGEQVVFVGEAKREGTGAQLRTALDQLWAYVDARPGARPLFIAPWISEQSARPADVCGCELRRRDRQRPPHRRSAWAVRHCRWGAEEPVADRQGTPVARGTGTIRALRALLDFTPPYGVRELAGRSEASAPTLSRVIELLQHDDLLTRDDRGTVVDLDWAGTIRRWARDYDVLTTNDSATYLQPRGLAALTETLRTTESSYTLTGSLAANEIAPYTPARLAMIYVENLREAVDAFDLRTADAGGNVVLLQPYDPIVFARTIERSNLRIVNPTQLAVDLLTGPGQRAERGRGAPCLDEGQRQCLANLIRSTCWRDERCSTACPRSNRTSARSS